MKFSIVPPSLTGPPRYERSCFNRYFKKVLDCWQVGAPQVTLLCDCPMSARAFNRYVTCRVRAQETAKTIVVASFTRKRVLKECIVFSPGDTAGTRENAVPVIRENVVYLFDGPPVFWLRSVPILVCLRPHYDWMKIMYKLEYHTCLYMPPWSLDELLDMNKTLATGVPEGLISTRFALFGGVARFCFDRRQRAYMALVERLWNQARRFETFGDIHQMLIGSSGRVFVLPRFLFHLHPESDSEFEFSSVKLASPYVGVLIGMNIKDTEPGRSNLTWFVNRCGCYHGVSKLLDASVLFGKTEDQAGYPRRPQQPKQERRS